MVTSFSAEKLSHDPFYSAFKTTCCIDTHCFHIGNSCACSEGFRLNPDNKTCEQIHPCDKPNKGGCAQTCTKTGKLTFVCECTAPEFKLAADGVTCEVVHPCDRKNKCEHKCVKVGDKFTCECPVDHIVEEDGSCTLKHPCDRVNKGGCGYKCVKVGEGMDKKCVCPPDQYLLPDGLNCKKSEFN